MPTEAWPPTMRKKCRVVALWPLFGQCMGPNMVGEASRKVALVTCRPTLSESPMHILGWWLARPESDLRSPSLSIALRRSLSVTLRSEPGAFAWCLFCPCVNSGFLNLFLMYIRMSVLSISSIGRFAVGYVCWVSIGNPAFGKW